MAFLVLSYVTLVDGYGLRQFLAALMAVLWGSRLTFFILYRRVLGKGEDPRYEAWMKEWGEEKDSRLLRFFMLQAVTAAFFSLPFLLIAMNPRPALSFIEGFGFILWVLAFAGEAAPDYQLELFKLDPASKGKTCRLGLWNYSRHPNYFFEFCIWCAVFVFALGSPWGILTVICPALMFYFLFRVTGIPKAEEQALRSRGDDYRRYQKTTSAFVPWFHRK